MIISVLMKALTGQFETDMKRASKTAQREMQRMEQEAQQRGAAIGVALAAAAAAATAAMNNAIQEADKLAETSEKLGLTTEEFTRMAYAAQMSGMEIDKFATANRNLGQRLEKNEALFAKLGVATRDAEGNYRSTTDIIRDLADEFQAMPEGVEQAQIAASLFGSKLGTEMIPLLNRGSEGLKQLESDADALGATLGGDAAQAAGEFDDAMNKMFIIIKAGLRDAMPALNEALRTTVGMFIALGSQAKKAWEILKFTFDGISSLISLQMDQYQRLGVIATLPAQIATKGVKEGLADWEAAWDQYRRAPEAVAIQTGVRMAQLAGRLNAIDEEGATQFEAFMRTTSSTGGTGPVVSMPEETGATGGGSRGRGRAAAEEEANNDKIRTDAKRAFADALAREAEARRMAKEQMREQLAQDREYIAAMIEDAEFELELMRMSNAERQTAIQLRGLEGVATEEQRQKLMELNAEREKESEMIGLMDQARYATANLFDDLISGSKSAGDAFKAFGDSIVSTIQDMIINNMVESLFGGFGESAGGGIGGMFSSFFGMFGFGGGRATGGSTLPGRIYRVNEEGPEMLSVGGRDYLMMGKQGGMVTPAHRTGRSVQQNINFVLPGRMDTRTQAQIAADTGRAANRALARA